jgi:hypothetical protein
MLLKKAELLQQLPCVFSGITAYNCSLDTFDTCLCPNIPMQSNLSTCVQQSCEFQDQVRKCLTVETHIFK